MSAVFHLKNKSNAVNICKPTQNLSSQKKATDVIIRLGISFSYSNRNTTQQMMSKKKLNTKEKTRIFVGGPAFCMGIFTVDY